MTKLQKETLKPFQSKPQWYTDDQWLQYRRVVESFKPVNHDVPERLQQKILEALHDELNWDWYDDCNGANWVSEPGWPKSPVTGVAYHPAYLVHDYNWTCKGANFAGNKLMFEIEQAYSMEKWRSRVRWAGVSLIGYPVHKVGELFKWMFK